MFTVRTAVIVLAALVTGLLVGVIAYLAKPAVGPALLYGGAAAAGTMTTLDVLIA
jgi:hypothetical protein